MKKYWIGFLSALTLLTSAFVFNRSKKESDRHNIVALDSLIKDSESVKISHAIATSNNTKDNKPRILRKLYTKDLIDTMRLPQIESKFLKALENQKVFLKNFEEEDFGNLDIESDQLEDVLDIFRKAKSSAQLSSALDAYQICGDGKGNVLFTGYYSPIISASRKRDSEYDYPIYLNASTNGNKDNLKVAYVRKNEDIKAMRMEGSAYLKFSDDDRVLVSFDGDFHSVENDEARKDDNNQPKKLLTTYTVFNQKDKPKPVGAAKVPLTSDLTIAVDDNYIPLGSVLLAQVPILDDNGNLIRHEYRFVLAQDTGSKIKGAAHIDLYMGQGANAKESIQYMNKYGKLWLLLPKEKEQKKILAQNF